MSIASSFSDTLHGYSYCYFRICFFIPLSGYTQPKDMMPGSISDNNYHFALWAEVNHICFGISGPGGPFMTT